MTSTCVDWCRFEIGFGPPNSTLAAHCTPWFLAILLGGGGFWGTGYVGPLGLVGGSSEAGLTISLTPGSSEAKPERRRPPGWVVTPDVLRPPRETGPASIVFEVNPPSWLAHGGLGSTLGSKMRGHERTYGPGWGSLYK